MHGSIVSRPRRGYLLLEVVLALGLAGMLLAVIFQMADGTLSLGKSLIDSGRADAKQEAFLNFFERGFSEMPGNAIIELTTTESNNRYLPRMVIQNAPTSFSFDGLPISAQAIVLTTTPSPNGVNIVLEYYEEPLLDGGDQLGEERQEPASTLIIFRDMWYFELRVLDSRTMEMISDWDIPGRLPLQIQVTAKFSPDDAEVEHYFWIPPKTSPVALMRGIQQQQQGGQLPGQEGQVQQPGAGGVVAPGQPGGNAGGGQGGQRGQRGQGGQRGSSRGGGR